MLRSQSSSKIVTEHLTPLLYFYNYRKEEVKTAITELLEGVPEGALNRVLEYLQSVKNKSSEEVEMANNLQKILSEDKQLLERLAK